ncbi:MAG: outer membrane beta-barrel protein [Nitrospira sp.]|nr:outer membrane beta-barrel protein [Nitrospira sp.]MCC7472191.1 outer membrane beta-barrel protein [Candidatus Nomurabacteria bacterium]
MRVLRVLFCVGLAIAGDMGGVSNVQAQDVSAQESEVKSARKTEAYFAPYLLGTFPIDNNLSIGGNGGANETFRGTNIRGSGGAGLKAGVYPGAMGGVLGLEGEFFGHGGKLKTPGGTFPHADADLLVLNWMVNVMARYPGEVLQPYVGAGAGASLANLRDITLQTSSGTMTGKAGDVAFAYQFLAGMRTYVNKNVYLFGEYKYFGSTYDWKSESSSGVSGPTTSLTFRTHIVALGLGLTF